MMFNILTIGDPHFKSDNGETTEELTTKTIELIKSRLVEIDAVCILGDILHRHEKIDLHPFHRAMLFLEHIHKELSKSDKDKYLYILIGNHDRSNNRIFMTNEHVFNPLKLWSNTFVADTCILHKPRDNFQVLLMPYVPPGRFEEAYKTIITDKYLEENVDIVLAHQEFHGAKMNAITSNEGDPWDSLKPLCVSGHIHDYQVLKSNLIYTGTPIQHGFTDIGKKTMSIFKFDGPHQYTEERIDLKIKGKITIKCSVNEFNIDECDIEKYFVKVKTHGTKHDIKCFIQTKEYKEAISDKYRITFQFLEIPAVEIMPDDYNKLPDRLSEVKFSKRISDLLDQLNDNDCKETFYKIFNN